MEMEQSDDKWGKSRAVLYEMLGPIGEGGGEKP
jgi:hypothetical protein